MSWPTQSLWGERRQSRKGLRTENNERNEGESVNITILGTSVWQAWDSEHLLQNLLTYGQECPSTAGNLKRKARTGRILQHP